MNAPQLPHHHDPRQRRVEVTQHLAAHLALQAIAMHLWLGSWTGARLRTLHGKRRDDSGEALSAAAIAVGLVLIAGAVILILRNKGAQIANNVCTNADPSSC